MLILEFGNVEEIIPTIIFSFCVFFVLMFEFGNEEVVTPTIVSFASLNSLRGLYILIFLDRCWASAF